MRAVVQCRGTPRSCVVREADRVYTIKSPERRRVESSSRMGVAFESGSGSPPALAEASCHIVIRERKKSSESIPAAVAL